MNIFQRTIYNYGKWIFSWISSKNLIALSSLKVDVEQTSNLES